MYVIFHLKEKGSEVLNDLLSDDDVGRLTILSRDGSKVSEEYTGLLILVEGNEVTVKKAISIVDERGGKLSDKKASTVYGKLKDESDSADQGVGFLFG